MLPLKDKWIVITRPKHQADTLRKKLEIAGAHTILFPLLEINQVKNQALVEQQLSKLGNYDLAIFISPNAVRYTLKKVSTSTFDSLKVAAIGKKTASLLKQHGIQVDYTPKEVSNSETLLAMSQIKTFSTGKNIVILRGNTGRELLKNTLVKQGANVDYITVYTRHCPQKDLKLLTKHFNHNELDIILISSGNSLANLFSLQAENSWLNNVSLLLGSERIKQQVLKIANYHGELLSTEDPNDEKVYQQLLNWGRLKNE